MKHGVLAFQIFPRSLEAKSQALKEVECPEEEWSKYHFLIKHKDEPSSLLKKNLTYDNLEKLGYSLQGMEMLGFSEEALEQLGYNNQNSSQTLHEITSDNHNAKRHMDTKESSLKEAIEAGYSLKELVEHYSCEELRKHFSVLELNTFFNGSQFREAGVSAREMREAGYSVLIIITQL